jgi:hypothetical protein
MLSPVQRRRLRHLVWAKREHDSQGRGGYRDRPRRLRWRMGGRAGIAAWAYADTLPQVAARLLTSSSPRGPSTAAAITRSMAPGIPLLVDALSDRRRVCVPVTAAEDPAFAPARLRASWARRPDARWGRAAGVRRSAIGSHDAFAWAGSRQRHSAYREFHVRPGSGTRSCVTGRMCRQQISEHLRLTSA